MGDGRPAPDWLPLAPSDHFLTTLKTPLLLLLLMIMGVLVENAIQEILVLAGMTAIFLLVALKKFNTRLE